MPKRIENPTPEQLRIRKIQERYHTKNPGKRAKFSARWQRNNPGKRKDDRKKWIENNPEQYARMLKNSRLKSTFGITLEQFDEMLRSQGYACAICGNGKAGGQGTFHVDHDHETKKVRGLLCNHCNTALGLFKDNLVILRSAMMYLKKARI